LSEDTKIGANVHLTFNGDLAKRVRVIYARLGYRSITAFVESAVREVLPREEREFEQIQEAIKDGKTDPSDPNW